MQRVGFSGENLEFQQCRYFGNSADILATQTVARQSQGRRGPYQFSRGSLPDAEPAAAGLDVVHRALQLQLRLWCSLLLSKLNATIICPTLLFPSSIVADRYLNVTSLTASLPKKVAA